MGPFGREGVVYKHIKGIYTGRLLVEESGYRIMQTLAQCGVLTKVQAVLAGCGKNIKGVFPRLVEKGYLDCYEGEHVPNLYSLSEKGAELMEVPYRTWDTGGLLRLAAANQLWLQIKEAWPGSTWVTSGEAPSLERAGIKFFVLAPRQGHVDRMITLRYLNKCQDRVFIVATDEAHAMEIALNCPPGRMVRYTWDDKLRNGLHLYCLEGKQFVEDTAFKAPENKSQNVMQTG